MIISGRVRRELATSTRFSDIRLIGSTDSTNRVVADLAAGGAPEGVVVAADVQSAGRGRLDRRWEAEPGSGLLVSVLLRPSGLSAERLHLVTAAAALAARQACLEVAQVETLVKWPNDLVVLDAKLAGILAESSGGAVVVGMGLNVHSGPPEAAVLDVESSRRVSRADVLVAWLRALDPLLGDWDRVSDLYRAACSTVGRRVRVELAGNESLEGTAVGVDDHGRLEVHDGWRRVVVASGDVVHLRPAR